jgi:hypothetical protein
MLGDIAVAYDLTISRFGAMPMAPIFENVDHGLEGKELVERFRAQTILLSKLVREKGGVNDLIAEIANDEFGAAVAEIASLDPKGGNQPTIVGMPPEKLEPGAQRDPNAPPFDALVGLTPYRKLRCNFADRDWILRTRASMTGCALQPGKRQTKLWWSFEGIPIGSKPATEHEAAEFNKLAHRLEEAAMPELRSAYIASLEEISKCPARFELSSDRIQISFADNDTPPVAELADAISVYKARLAAIEQNSSEALAPAFEGLQELRQFVADIPESGLQITEKTLHVETELVPDVIGLYGRKENDRSFSALIAGFARRAGGGSGFGVRLEPLDALSQESWVRRVSPSRQLSAILANREARNAERRRLSLS